MEHAMPNSKEIEAKSHNPVPQGYVLGAGEGEHLSIFVMAATSSSRSTP